MHRACATLVRLLKQSLAAFATLVLLGLGVQLEKYFTTLAVIIEKHFTTLAVIMRFIVRAFFLREQWRLLRGFALAGLGSIAAFATLVLLGLGIRLEKYFTTLAVIIGKYFTTLAVIIQFIARSSFPLEQWRLLHEFALAGLGSMATLAGLGCIATLARLKSMDTLSGLGLVAAFARL